MGRVGTVLGLVLLLLMPVYANAQSPERISIIDNFGNFDRGESLFIYGQVASIQNDSFLIMQIINPEGDLCQIQQLVPLPNGEFMSDAIPLKGRICGIVGEYEVKLFYGDYSTTVNFQVTSKVFSEPDSEILITSAKNLLSKTIFVLDEQLDQSFASRIDDALLSDDLSTIENVYVDLLDEFYSDDFSSEITPVIRPAIASSLSSVSQMLIDGEISFDNAKSINRTVFSSIFYYEINDKRKSIDLLSDVFVEIRNINPTKTPAKVLTFDELEETLLNLMKKSDTVMNRFVKEEVAFIFARGTAPVHVQEISDLVDLLSEARYLDIVSRKQSELYRLIQNDWEGTKISLESKESLADLLASGDKVHSLHQAALLLGELEDVDRFISSNSEENSELANLLMSDWNNLKSDLEFASSPNDIIESEIQIKQMKQIIDISSRISKAVEITQSNEIDSSLVSDWKFLLEKIENATSTDEILSIVSEFDNTMTELREKRNPLTVLKFEYQTMKQKAELQADYDNLYLIDNALKILNTAEQMESGNPSIMRIDRIEVLLTWVSEQAPKIKSDLNSYDADAFKIRASDILQRAKSIENLVELGLRTHKFLPGYIEFTSSFNEKIDNVRDLVIKNDLNEADNLVRSLFAEWNQVSKAYADDPYGSSIGYSADEIKRIDYRERLDNYSNMVTKFYNSEFSQYATEYDEMISDAYSLIDYGNFIDAESKILEIGEFLSEHLVLNNPRIIYDISYDQEKNIWIIQGAVEKSIFDRRSPLYVTVFNMDGSTHSNLEFTDTKFGDFYTQWIAPADPGLYVVMLQYQDSQATQIVNVKERFEHTYTPTDLSMVELARDFEELTTFIEKFGNDDSSFSSTINEIKIGLTSKDSKKVNEKLDDLRYLIEKYLPARSRSAIVEVQYSDNGLVVSGAVQKTISFREDLFVDIFDQRGNLIESITLKDNSSGLFNEIITRSFDSGVYVAQLQYHDVIVTDFFTVR
ncbi:MAG: hypothetical protein RI100_02720 [Nitrosarchaeum sp.]|jgi:hypothetical protein|uniref:hypothetical protein n=1 Tax=Nitrosarchaeum sp. TaxID=2026886 RepID=UPI002DF5CB0D|nr:hypothetical protein [Nitrosarchaeum sp.]